MKTRKLLGIWMDHSIAHLTALQNDTVVSRTIEADSFIREDESVNSKDESLIQNKEKNDLSNYFNQLVQVIKDYDEVLLYGPTEAKSELFNQIENDHNLNKIKFTLKTTDKMTENQQEAFVKDFFINRVHSTSKIKNRAFYFI
jgi:stalled ribosome rescue protein Dom34